MSFSSKVKEELAKVLPGARHCQLAELAAIVHLGGTLSVDDKGKYDVALHSENDAAFRKYFTLSKKTFIIGTDVLKLLQAIKVCDGEKQIRTLREEVNPVLLKNSCCKRAYLRGNRAL